MFNKKLSFFIVIVFLFCGCSKEWEQSIVYTTNLSLLFTPDSVDANNVYYYEDGMKLQIKLFVKSGETIMKDDIVENHDNYHWDESYKNVVVTGSVISLVNDTSYHIEDYPVIMRIYKDHEKLYEDYNSENSYSL